MFKKRIDISIILSIISFVVMMVMIWMPGFEDQRLMTGTLAFIIWISASIYYVVNKGF